jgi:hypothetical protein
MTSFDYEKGLTSLRPLVDQRGSSEQRARFDTFEADLRSNLKESRLYGDDDGSRKIRSRIVGALNELVRQLEPTLSFNDLCQGHVLPPLMPSPITDPLTVTGPPVPLAAYELELSLTPLGAGAYRANAVLATPTKTIEDLASNCAVAINVAALQQLHGNAYGKALRTMLFADDALKRALERSQMRAIDTERLLRLRLRLDPQDNLTHAVRWETLHGPYDDRPLFTSASLLFSRYLSSADSNRIYRAQAPLKSLIAVAAPNNLAERGLNPINRDRERELAGKALARTQRTVAEKASLLSIADALRSNPDILYLVCHGAIQNGRSLLYLENELSRTEAVDGERFVSMLRNLQRRPILVTLVSCVSAGRSNDPRSSHVAIGPQLAEAGIGAVLAMSDQIKATTAAVALPIFFDEVVNHGYVDLAAAVMRNQLQAAADDWWQPVLFMRLSDGQIYDQG